MASPSSALLRKSVISCEGRGFKRATVLKTSDLFGVNPRADLSSISVGYDSFVSIKRYDATESHYPVPERPDSKHHSLDQKRLPGGRESRDLRALHRGLYSSMKRSGR